MAIIENENEDHEFVICPKIPLELIFSQKHSLREHEK
jgi:hypothetical protein